MVTSPTFIPGYKATVTLNADNISASGSVVSLSQTRNLLAKPTFGSTHQHSLGGQRLGTFSANGHVSAEQVADLQSAFDSDAPIAFSLQIGDAAGPTDGGMYEGDCVLSDYTIEANADGEWDWSIEATTSGIITYTPAAP
jgi:predicted secreted protein